jgi:hypothetical protein
MSFFDLFYIPNAPALFGIKRFKIVFVFQYKGHDKINDHRAAERKKRKIDKVHTYRSTPDAKFLSPPFTYAKGFMFKPLYNIPDHDKQK